MSQENLKDIAFWIVVLSPIWGTFLWAFWEGTLRLSGALTGGKSAADIVSDYATLTNGAVVFDFGGDDIITLSNLNALTGLAEDIEIF